MRWRCEQSSLNIGELETSVKFVESQKYVRDYAIGQVEIEENVGALTADCLKS
jgi:hypothetical protein